METPDKTSVTVKTTIDAPAKKVWEFWTEPEHIMHWYHASEDWHVPYAENDLRTDGKFKTTMAAKDGSFGFDFEGVYTNIQTYKLIEYTLGDGREVNISFDSDDNMTLITQTFDAENVNPVELQRNGWQAILDNFKQYTESAV